MDKEKIILELTDALVELRAAKKNLEELYYLAIKDRASERKKAEAIQQEYDRLLFEFSRALEVIRGEGLKFESSIIAAETQKGVCNGNKGNGAD